jgi:hypothetical protein
LPERDEADGRRVWGDRNLLSTPKWTTTGNQRDFSAGETLEARRQTGGPQ